MYVCVCNQITDSQIRNACNEGVTTFESLQNRLKVATCCGRCSDCAKRLLRESSRLALTCEMTPVAT